MKLLKKKKKIITNLDTTKEKKVQKIKKIDNKKTILYIVGEPYFIEGVKYIPTENYNYKQKGLATYYGKELHNKRTINNDYNKVTELLGRHKTLPLPSIVKLTNLENGLSLIIKIHDRHDDNSAIIQVSRKVAQLLKFYHKKIIRVQVEILKEPSRQMKIVTESRNDPNFETTIKSAPTELVKITDLGETDEETVLRNYVEPPIELGFEQVKKQDLFLEIYEFDSHNEAKEIINILALQMKITIQNLGKKYSI